MILFEDLRVLYLGSNPITSSINHYRKKTIAKISTLTYLDDRPVKNRERRLAEAWFRGGKSEEIKERQKIQEEKNKSYKNYIGEIEEARKKAKQTKIQNLKRFRRELEQKNKTRQEEEEELSRQYSEKENSYLNRLKQVQTGDLEKEKEESELALGNF